MRMFKSYYYNTWIYIFKRTLYLHNMLLPFNYNAQYCKFYVQNNQFYSVVSLILERVELKGKNIIWEWKVWVSILIVDVLIWKQIMMILNVNFDLLCVSKTKAAFGIKWYKILFITLCSFILTKNHAEIKKTQKLLFCLCKIWYIYFIYFHYYSSLPWMNE